MGSFFEWNASELGLNVPEMDEEHIKLISIMNECHKAWVEKAPFETLDQLIESLAQYTVKHFADEEAYMDKIKFEGAVTHKIIHKQLLSQFKGHVEEFRSKKVLTDSFFNFLKVWLTSHIRGIDTKYANAAKKKSG